MKRTLKRRLIAEHVRLSVQYAELEPCVNAVFRKIALLVRIPDPGTVEIERYGELNRLAGEILDQQSQITDRLGAIEQELAWRRLLRLRRTA